MNDRERFLVAQEMQANARMIPSSLNEIFVILKPLMSDETMLRLLREKDQTWYALMMPAADKDGR